MADQNDSTDLSNDIAAQSTEPSDTLIDTPGSESLDQEESMQPMIESKIVDTVSSKNVLIIKAGTHYLDNTLNIWFYCGSRKRLNLTNSDGVPLDKELSNRRFLSGIRWFTDVVWSPEVEERWQKQLPLDKIGKRRKVIRESLRKLYGQMSRGIKKKITSKGRQIRRQNRASWARWQVNEWNRTRILKQLTNRDRK